MNKETIIELENFIYQVKKQPNAAASMMTGIIGVIIGLKPAMIGNFTTEEFSTLPYDQFQEMLDSLYLKPLFFHQSISGKTGISWIENIFISKDLITALKTHEAFENLWGTMDDVGRIFAPEMWNESSRQIGELLGYPKTATEYYIKNIEIEDSEEDTKRMARNRYYIHSPKHEKQEFEDYDLKLNQAIAELAPKTASILTGEAGKRWLEY